MKKALTFIVTLVLSTSSMICQENNASTYILLKSKDAKSITDVQINLEKFSKFYDSTKGLDSFQFQSNERKKFKRFPGIRKGIQIIDLTSQQRIELHDVLNDLLSGQGYLKLIGILSNEDASARVDEELGREKYWITFFGEPVDKENWGFRFEGHHASFNFSFYGDILISSTPFIIGCDPAIMQDGKWSPLTKDDEFREGYNILFEEEDLVLELIRELSEKNQKKGFVTLDSGIDIICEDNKVLDMKKLYNTAKIEEGISFSDLDELRKLKFTNLVNVYFGNLKFQEVSQKYLFETNTKFIFSGKLQKNGKLYYRIVNEDFIIEFQNIGNHIHCIMRSFKNDFGANETK